MRALARMLILVFLGMQVRADEGGTASVDQRGGKGGNKQTLIATVFGEPLYLEQVAPPNVELNRKERRRREFEEGLRSDWGRRTYEKVWGAALRRYVQRKKLGVSEEELAAIAASVERRLKTAPELPEGAALTPAERQGMMTAWARASLLDWKVCKSLYQEYGGRVGIGSLGAWTAFDGQNALLREHLQAGDIKFHHAEIENAFWQHTKTANFADAYPKGEQLKRLLATPPYLHD